MHMENAVVRTPVGRASTRPVTVVVDRVKPDGLKVGETWFNYGRTFKGERLTAEAVGLEVTMTLVQSKDGKEYVRSIDKIASQADAPADEEESSEADVAEETVTASPEALTYAEDLTRKRQISSEELEQLCRIAFKKAFNALASDEASKLIEFFGGYKRSGKR